MRRRPAHGYSDAPGIAREIAARFAAVAAPAPVTIGGLSGQQVDLRAWPDWPFGCAGGVAESGRYRAIVLDTSHDAIGVYVRAYSGGEFDAFIGAAMAIVESFVFDVEG